MDVEINSSGESINKCKKIFDISDSNSHQGFNSDVSI